MTRARKRLDYCMPCSASVHLCRAGTLLFAGVLFTQGCKPIPNCRFEDGLCDTEAGIALLSTIEGPPGQFVAVGNNGSAAYSIDEGLTWTTASTPGSENYQGVSADNSGRWIATALNSEILIGTNQGQNWVLSSSPITASMSDINGRKCQVTSRSK